MTHADDLVSISELHRITGYDRALISEKLQRSGLKPVKSGKGHLYPRRKSIAILTAGSAGSSSVLSEADAKSRKAVAEAEKAEITVAKLRGELVSADEMRRAAAELVKSLYQRIVRVEPAVIASKCVGLDAIGIETGIRDAMAAIFDEVRVDLSSFVAVEETTAEPDEVSDEGNGDS